MDFCFNYGSKTIQSRFLFRDRKTLGITVTPDLEVIVSVPNGADMERVQKILLKRAPWILKQQSYFLTYQPKQPPKKYVSGETHLYLGRGYRLKVEIGDIESVKLVGRHLHVVCKTKNNAKMLVEQWYWEHATKKLIELTKRLTEKFKIYGVEPKEIQIKYMPKRWGSCTAKGFIVLNPELIKAPTGCIEYVIIHELCHLVHFNHNTKFLNLQSTILPTWQTWKNRLEKVMV